MADEAVQGSDAVAEAEITQEVKEDAIDAIVNDDLDMDMSPLFDDEDVTDAELKGEEPEPQGKETPDDPDPKGKEAPEKPQETKKVDEKKDSPEKKGGEEEEKPEEKPEEDGKPPAGFVPQEALREARYEVRTLKQQLSDLQSENESLASQLQNPAQQKAADADEWKDFKVLSKGEFRNLVEEDPDAALVYQHELREFEKYQAEQQNIERNQQRAIQARERVITNAAQRIAETIPGIYDEGSEVVVELAKFAQEQGEFNDISLEALTNPATVIKPKGSKQAYLLGDGAYSVLKLINDLKASKTAGDPETLRASIKTEIEAEVRADERKKVTAEITAKLKSGQGDFRSISDGPGMNENPGDVKKMYTEEDFWKMTPEEQERVLKE